MKQRMLAIICAAFLCILTTGCENNEPTAQEQPVVAQPESQLKSQETESVSNVQPEPEPVPKPDPELQEPLWSGVQVSYSRSIQRNKDTVDVFETDSNSAFCMRLYQMENGDRVTLGRVQNTVGEIPAYIWEVPTNGIIRWYDRATDQWTQQPLEPGTYQFSMVELAMDDGTSFLIYLPKTYRTQEHEVLEYLAEKDGSLSVAKVGDSWQFILLASLPDQSCVSDFTIVQGPHPMLNWTHSYCGNLWKNYTMETEGKWCFDGYYWPCPSNYIPSGANYLYACPASYLIKSFAYAASVHPAADNLALAMLDTMSLQQNEDGFWPTSPRSDWLYTDYGVDKGFYDTRFNTDLIEIYRRYYEYSGGDILLNSMERYVEFYTDYAQREHFTTENGGWFIPDYGPASTAKPHSSLNHQLAECIELYYLADILQRPDLEELADRMVLAVADTQSQWVTPSGDLHYCVFPDGSFGMQDYPYLTYNDLFELQNLLISRRGEPNNTLTFLMNQTRQWMDANGITEYNR